MRLKALALVILVFSATFAICSAIAVVHPQATERKIDFTGSHSLVQVGNGTVITPNGPIDTPGGPT